MKILNNKGPKIGPCRAPNNISLHELYPSFIFTLCFLFERELCINFKNVCQSHTHLAQQLKAREADNRKLSTDQ